MSSDIAECPEWARFPAAPLSVRLNYWSKHRDDLPDQLSKTLYHANDALDDLIKRTEDLERENRAMKNAMRIWCDNVTLAVTEANKSLEPVFWKRGTQA